VRGGKKPENQNYFNQSLRSNFSTDKNMLAGLIHYLKGNAVRIVQNC